MTSHTPEEPTAISSSNSTPKYSQKEKKKKKKMHTDVDSRVKSCPYTYIHADRHTEPYPVTTHTEWPERANESHKPLNHAHISE